MRKWYQLGLQSTHRFLKYEQFVLFFDHQHCQDEPQSALYAFTFLKSAKNLARPLSVRG